MSCTLHTVIVIFYGLEVTFAQPVVGLHPVWCPCSLHLECTSSIYISRGCQQLSSCACMRAGLQNCVSCKGGVGLPSSRFGIRLNCLADFLLFAWPICRISLASH
ncbi:hypothetical protein QBC35DRAFT_482939 [Podospora australis]|uniref:Secreted protein n=1 Tax=Podospora australis TaxID=1536484 RepID=A0AAN7AP98_9PEZI|nr:hypothetical protein QBC35DRAFT_482939 [Podospora australis]